MSRNLKRNLDLKNASEIKTGLKIRSMIRSDLSAVYALEKTIFPDPWPLSAFEDLLTENGWGGLVAETDSHLLGYACYLLAGPESHVTNIAVSEPARRKSVAKRLLENILQVALEAQCEYTLLEVRPSNMAARKFYEKHGFTVMYRRPDYYSLPVEEAVVMVRYFDQDKSRD